MKNAIEMNIGGIKCDSDGCDYKDDSVKADEYANWIDKPCPICGCNLLTKKDYDEGETIIRIAKMFNETLPPANGNEELAILSVEYDGNGVSKMEISEVSNKPSSRKAKTEW